MSIIDIGTDPLAPKIIANLPLDNTLVGPPVNLAITPDEGLALVANSINIVRDGGALKQVPDNRLWVIDLTTDPPKLIDTVAVGKQPSGMSINRAGNLALVANRADGSISVLRITGKKVELIDTVVIGEQVAHVRFTPDGKRALAAKFPGHKIALLDVNGEKVSYNKFDLPVGLWPYNVDVTPDGKLAITADNGTSAATVSLAASPVRTTGSRRRVHRVDRPGPTRCRHAASKFHCQQAAIRLRERSTTSTLRPASRQAFGALASR